MNPSQPSYYANLEMEERICRAKDKGLEDGEQKENPLLAAICTIARYSHQTAVRGSKEHKFRDAAVRSAVVYSIYRPINLLEPSPVKTVYFCPSSTEIDKN